MQNVPLNNSETITNSPTVCVADPPTISRRHDILTQQTILLYFLKLDFDSFLEHIILRRDLSICFAK